MGRFFQTSSPQFLQNTQYNPNLDLMMKVIQNDNAVRNAIEEQATKTEYELLNTPHLQFDREALKEIQGGYTGDINRLVSSVYNDVDVIKSTRPRMKELQNKLLKDKLNGRLGAISNRYSAYQSFMKDNEGLKEKDPTTYRAAMAYELNKLREEAAKNPLAIFTGYKVVGTPDFRKDLIAEIDKLKASSMTVPDGNGYLVKMKELPVEKIMGLAVSNILGRPEYREFARQQTMYGLGGLMNPDGTMINPYTMVGPDGKEVTAENIDSLTDEYKKQIQRILNPNWRFSNEINNIANAFAYKERDMSPDSTHMSKLKMAQDAQQHAQSMALRRQELALKEREFQYKQLKDSGAFGGGQGFGGSGGSGDGGGKGNDSHPNVLAGDLEGRRLDEYQSALNLNDDLASIGNLSPEIRARLRGFQGNVLKHPGLRSIKLGRGDTGASLVNFFINKGISPTDLREGAARKYLENFLRRNADATGAVNINGQKKYLSDKTITSLADDLAQSLFEGYNQVASSVYADYNKRQSTTHGIPLDKGTSEALADYITTNGAKKVTIKDSNGNQLSDEDIRLLLDSDNLQMYAHPGAAGKYGVPVAIWRTHEDGKGNKIRTQYIVESTNMENVIGNYAIQSVARSFPQGSSQHMQIQELARAYYGGKQAGKNFLDKYDIEAAIPGGSKYVQRINFLNNGMIMADVINGKGAIERVHVNTAGQSPEEMLASIANFIVSSQNNQ